MFFKSVTRRLAVLLHLVAVFGFLQGGHSVHAVPFDAQNLRALHPEVLNPQSVITKKFAMPQDAKRKGELEAMIKRCQEALAETKAMMNETDWKLENVNFILAYRCVAERFDSSQSAMFVYEFDTSNTLVRAQKIIVKDKTSKLEDKSSDRGYDLSFHRDHMVFTVRNRNDVLAISRPHNGLHLFTRKPDQSQAYYIQWNDQGEIVKVEDLPARPPAKDIDSNVAEDWRSVLSQPIADFELPSDPTLGAQFKKGMELFESARAEARQLLTSETLSLRRMPNSNTYDAEYLSPDNKYFIRFTFSDSEGKFLRVIGKGARRDSYSGIPDLKNSYFLMFDPDGKDIVDFDARIHVLRFYPGLKLSYYGYIPDRKNLKHPMIYWDQQGRITFQGVKDLNP